MDRIFQQVASSYIKQGLPIVPAAGKRPIVSGFGTFATSGMEDEAIWEYAESYPDANIALLVGGKSRIVALDFDYDGYEAQEYEQMIRNLLPPICVEKVGKKGFTAFYKSDLSTVRKNASDRRAFEVLSTGTCTIMPPSMHPDGMRYRWVKNDLCTFDLDNLPELTRKDYEALSLATDKFFGLQGTVKESGRNSAIWAYAYKTAKESVDFESWLNGIVQYDSKKFGERSYFDDKSERGSKTSAQFAEAMCKSWLGSIKRKHKELYNEEFSFRDMPLEAPEKGFYRDARTQDQIDKGKPVTMAPDFMGTAYYYEKTRRYVFRDDGAYRYENGIWQPLVMNYLNRAITEGSSSFWHPRDFKNFQDAIKARCGVEGFNFKSTEGLINLENGILDVRNRILLSHSEEYFFRGKSPVSYDPTATCPAFLVFLSQIFSGDAERIKLVQQMIGYILIGGYPFLHRVFCLIGWGRNGKSTLQDVMRDLLGRSNYSAVSLANLHLPFSAVMLSGKMANIVGETPTGKINAEIFKSVTSGEGIRAARKFQDESIIDVSARFIFACNAIPTFDDDSDGLKDRLVIIPFDIYIDEDDRDTSLKGKLELELPGILNWAMDGAREIMQTRTLVKPAAVERSKDVFSRNEDSIYSFYKEMCILQHVDDGLPIADIYERYVAYCADMGTKPNTKRKFIVSFRKLLGRECKRLKVAYEVDARRRINEKQIRVISCIKLKDFWEEPD